MRAGSMKHRIKFMTPSKEADKYNDPLNETYILAFDAYAEKKNLRLRDTQSNGAERGQVTAVFKVRYNANITSTMRVEWNGQTFEIENIVELGNREGLELELSEVTT